MNVTSKRLAATVVIVVAVLGLLSAQRRGDGPDVPRVGYIGLRPFSESAASMDSISALKDGLRDLGYVEDNDYVLQIRSANNDPSRYPELTAELTKLQVKVIVAASTPAAVAIHDANPTMPIVVRGPDIIGAGLAQSMTHPGGVVTGIDELADGITEKRLGLLKQAVPSISHVAVLSSAPTETGHRKAFAESERAASALNVRISTFEVSETSDLAPIFARLVNDGADALFCSGGVLSRPVQQRIVDLAARHRLPAMYPLRDYVDLSGLMSYAYRNSEMFRAAASYVDRILKGANAGDLPLTIWDRHYLTVNTKTAGTLGLTFPPSVLSQADAIIK